ncbi:hypothetical protein PG997_013365 [Apiospora hydei]|uniref:BHLH domain-containing protein n=1 Tax=Apiospora hydei TaxID=1337664 RepID=A0ABR1V9I0_9PEZI
MHGGRASYDFPQSSVPHLDFEADSNTLGTPLTPEDPCGSVSPDDYDFSSSLQFLDFEPNSRDITMDYYTTNTPKQVSPSPLLADSITVAPPPPPPLPQPTSPPLSPQPQSSASDKPSKKRPRVNSASSPHPAASRSPSPQGEAQKPQRPHAAVEKRYRVSLNDKIEALRVCLESRKRPKRQCQSAGDSPAAGSGGGGGGTTDGVAAPGGSGGATPASSAPAMRMSKAEVLTEAVEYVQQLEEENGVMLGQIQALIERMQATQRALQLPSFTAGKN